MKTDKALVNSKGFLFYCESTLLYSNLNLFFNNFLIMLYKNYIIDKNELKLKRKIENYTKLNIFI